MGYNSDIIALGIREEILNLPKRMAVAAAKKAYRSAIQHTKQDSGQAAFNTMYSINSTMTSAPFVIANDGSEPTVGKRGDQRTANQHTFVVARPKIAEFEAELNAIPRGDLQSITIYSTLRQDGKYADENHADVATAFEIASNSGVLDAEVGRVFTASRFR